MSEPVRIDAPAAATTRSAAYDLPPNEVIQSIQWVISATINAKLQGSNDGGTTWFDITTGKTATGDAADGLSSPGKIAVYTTSISGGSASFYVKSVPRG